MEKESEESLNPVWKRGNSSASISIEEHVKEVNSDQVGDDGRPVPVGPEILQRFDDAVKRYNETRAQVHAKPKAAPRRGVTASMILLEPDDLQNGIAVNAAQALDDDEFYAMLDSGTNAIIVPLHRGRSGGMPSTKRNSHQSGSSSI